MSKFNPPLVGSYPPEDCLFLLKPIQVNYQTIENKEKLIQSGQLHYSEIIHKESAPSAIYRDLFLQMTATYKKTLAQQVMRLAQLICQQRPNQSPLVLVSLARAGTPIGVLLQHALRDFLKQPSVHYSLSIIRDRGIDTVALDYLLAQGYAPESLVFIDGWTAKGVITRELQQAIKQYNQTRGVKISPQLAVISDIGGTADIQATFKDYTIPSALLNSTISGLISRSILNHQIGVNDFHGCVSYQHLQKADLSNWFIKTVCAEMKIDQFAPKPDDIKMQRQQETQQFLQYIQQEYQVSDINRIKPGIAEATRVLLRRVPDQLLIQNKDNPDISHLKRLALEKKIPIQVIEKMPFGACALIKDVH